VIFIGMKTFSPAGSVCRVCGSLLLALFLAGLSFSSVRAQSGGTLEPVDSWPRAVDVVDVPTGREDIASSNTEFERTVLLLTNQARRAHGLPELQWSDSLARAARYHAAHMAQNEYFSHDTQLANGRRLPPNERIGLFDSASAAENIAMGHRNPEQVMERWLLSPGHRQNILRPDLQRLGVGYVAGHWVQVFGL
jgi:uncharacterized protein YkwD